jgi:hypothetical protein
VIGKVRGLFSWLPTGEILPGMTDDEHDEMGRAWSSRSGCLPTCSAPANDRQSAADGNVFVPAPTRDQQLFRWAKGDLNPHVPKDTGT